MLIAAIVVGVIALIAMVIVLLEGIIIMLSRNHIRKGLKYIGGAVLLGLLAGRNGVVYFVSHHAALNYK